MIDRDLREQLLRYAGLEGTELGEACRTMCDLSRYQYYMSDRFVHHLMYEMKEQLQNFVENCEIIEKSENVNRTYQELSWKSPDTTTDDD